MLGHIADDERVAQVRLVRPIFQHRFPVSDAREGIWRHGLTLAELLKYAMKHRLDSIKNIILRDEAHFEIKLVEFARRTIGTGVFVTKARRSEEHTSELQSLMRNSYAVFCLKKKKKNTTRQDNEDKRNKRKHSNRTTH